MGAFVMFRRSGIAIFVAALKIKSEAKDVQDYRHTVRVRLTDGELLDPSFKLTDADKIPVKPFRDDLIRRENAKGFQASLDPVRAVGNYVAEAPK